MYKSSNELSTTDIEEKIKEINAAEVIVKEEQILETLLEEEIEREIDELTDIAASEIVAEEIAEEIVEEIAAANLDNLIPELSELEIDSLIVSEEEEEKSEDSTDEGSGRFPIVDFGDIMEVIL